MSMASSQHGFFSAASKLVSSVLGTGKKTKTEPLKSIQLAAAAAKKVSFSSQLLKIIVLNVTSNSKRPRERQRGSRIWRRDGNKHYRKRPKKTELERRNEQRKKRRGGGEKKRRKRIQLKKGPFVNPAKRYISELF